MANDLWSKSTRDILGNVSWGNEPDKQQAPGADAPNWAGYWPTQLQNAAVGVPQALIGAARGVAGGLDSLTRYNQRHSFRDENGNAYYTPEGSFNPEGSNYYSVTPTKQEPQNIWGQIENSLGNAVNGLEKYKWTSERAPSGTFERLGGAVVANLPQMAVTGAATAFGTPALGLAVMSGMVAGDEYNELRNKGVESGRAAAYSAANAAIQAPLERLGIESWIPVKNILAKHGLLKAVGKGFVTEGFTEAIQEVPEEVSRYYAEHGTMEGFDGKDLGLSMAESGLVGGFYGALFSGIGHAGSRRSTEPAVAPGAEAAPNAITSNAAANIAGGSAGPAYTTAASGIDISQPNFNIADDADYDGMSDPTKLAANLAIGKWNSLHPDHPITMTSGKRGGDGTSHHDHGNAFDVVCDLFEGEEGRKYRDEYASILSSLGLTPFDEYNGSGNEAYARGENFHATVPEGWNGGNANAAGNSAAGSSTDAFLTAIAGQESGGEGSPYDAVNSKSGAFGKYQIMPGTWNDWAPKAGVDPSDHSPEAQEKVARAMADYYRENYGDEGAIVAWYAGEGTAQRFVNGEMSADELTALQEGYPSIASYLDSVKGRMGGAVYTPQPQTALEFLQDAEAGMPRDTQEGQARSDALQKVIEQGTKEEQDDLARTMGWQENASSAPQDAPQAAGRAITQNRVTNAPRAQQRAPITVPQPPQQIQMANRNSAPLDAATNQQAAPITNAPAPVGSANTRGIIPQAQARRQRNGGQPVNPVVRANMGLPPQAPAGPLAPVEGQAQQAPRRPSQQEIKAALGSKDLNNLVKRAYVDGDQQAAAAVEQNVNPYILEAVRNKVAGGNNHASTENQEPVRELLHRPEENPVVNPAPQEAPIQEGQNRESGEAPQPVGTIRAGDTVAVDGKNYTVNHVLNKGKTLQVTDGDGNTLALTGDRAQRARKVSGEGESAPTSQAQEAAASESNGMAYPNDPEGQLEEREMEFAGGRGDVATKLQQRIEGIAKEYYTGKREMGKAISAIRGLLRTKAVKELEGSTDGRKLKEYADGVISDMRWFDKHPAKWEEAPGASMPDVRDTNVIRATGEQAESKPETEDAKERSRARTREVREKLTALQGKGITNEETGIVASFGRTGTEKMLSNAAVQKSIANGYTREEHLSAVENIKPLFEKAHLLSSGPDTKNHATNVLSIKRFVSPIDARKEAYITVKESVENGHKIYSVELEALNKRSTTNKGQQTQKGTTGIGGTSSDSIVPESTQEVKAESDNPFGSVKDADKEAERIFGLKPVSGDNGEIHLKHKLVDDSDEAIERYIKEFRDAGSQLNSGLGGLQALVPMFKICAAYTQRGIVRFAEFAQKAMDKFKSAGFKEADIEPWLSPAWEAVKHFQEIDGEFDSRKLVAAMKVVGSRYAGGMKDVDAIKSDLRKLYGDKGVEILNDYLDASFKGVREYYAKEKKNTIGSSAPASEKARKPKTATVRTDDGREFSVTYRIIPADRLVASNDWDFGVNENYPSELQPRDRSRPAMKAQVDNMARSLRPADLAESRSVNEGAPVVNSDNVVENGNGRTMAIARAYHHGGEAYQKSAQTYKNALVENAEQYGYSSEEVRAMENPVLVRQRSGDSDNLQKAITTSTDGGMKMGAGQQAKVDAQKLTNNTLRKYNYDGSGDLTLASNRDFVVSALNEMVGANDHDTVFDKDGLPTKAGIQRVQSALAALAYGDSTLLDRMSESTDADNKTVTNAFMAAAPQVAAIANRIERKTVSKDYDLPGALGRVISFYFGAKENKKTIDFALGETSMFGDSPLKSEGERAFARFLDENYRNRKKISDAIVQMVKYVDGANEGSDSFFADSAMNLSDIMQAAVGETNGANPFGNGTMGAENPNVTKEGGNADGRLERGESAGGPVEMGRPGEGGTAGRTGREAARGNREGENREGGSGHEGHAGSDEPAGQGTVQGRPAETERSASNEPHDRVGDEAGRPPRLVEKPISPKVDKIEERIAKGEMKNASDRAGGDYHPEEEEEVKRGAQRVRDNVTAVKLLKKIESEHRKATPDEQAILAKYSGWGGLGFALDESYRGFKPELNALVNEALDANEMAAANREQSTAFYTPDYAVKAMWNITARLGFKGGRILDPSCGTGKFYAYMPQDIRSGSHELTGIELSPIPERIAAQLFQGEGFSFANQPYQQFGKYNSKGNHYDLAITNVPFDSQITGTVGGVKYKLHNYFFAKALSQVRPGGLVVFMTGSSTMDGSGDAAGLRDMLSKNTELVGMVRLPTSVFKGQNANVTTDIVVLRKLNEGEAPKPKSWEDALTLDGKTNHYFTVHKENVLGDITKGYRGLEVTNDDNADVRDRLEKLVEQFPEGIYQPRAVEDVNSQPHAEATAKATGVGGYGSIVTTSDGKIARVDFDDKGNLKPRPFSKEDQPRAKAFKELADVANDLLVSQSDPGMSDAELDTKRKNLNRVYDGFVKKFGCVNDPDNQKIFVTTNGWGVASALESGYVKPGKKQKHGTAGKAAIFTQRTTRPPQEVTSAANASDALVLSLVKKGKVDLDYMSGLLGGKSPKAVVKELGDKLFYDPAEGGYVTRDEYLSGNVRIKLDEAREAAEKTPALKKNVEALEKVIPKDVHLNEISLRLGSSPLVVPPSMVQDFVNSITGTDGAIRITYDNVLQRWYAEERGYIPEQINYTRYGVPGVGGSKGIPMTDVLNACFTGTDITGRAMFKAGKDDSAAVRQEREDAKVRARDAQAKLNQEFTKWLSSDTDRRNTVERGYNFRFNANVNRTYSGTALATGGRLPGMSEVRYKEGKVDPNGEPIRLRPHQLDAVWRTVNQRGVLYAHCVGSGKTWTMQAAGMELKRLGLAHKIIYTTPKNVVYQFATEFRELYPNVKVLVLDSDTLPSAPGDLEWAYRPIRIINGKEVIIRPSTPKKLREAGKPKVDEKGHPQFLREPATPEERAARLKNANKREAAFKKIKTEDWDAIVVSHETFGNIPMDPQSTIAFLNGEIAKYRQALDELNNSEGRDSQKKRKKDLEKRVEKYEFRLTELLERMKRVHMGSESFETLGIDQIFVDEADLFKNLMTPTTMDRIKGVASPNNYSARAEDMYMKTRYLLGNNGAHGVVFATGTPISNSITEMYVMTNYLAGEELDARGIHSFDQFSNLYVNIGPELMQKSDGSGLAMRQAVKGLQNAPEARNLFRSFADVKMIKDLPYIQEALPKRHDVNVVIPDNVYLGRLRQDMQKRSAAIRSRSPMTHTTYGKGGKTKEVPDNYLTLAGMYRAGTISLWSTPEGRKAPREFGLAKIIACAEKIKAEYDKSTATSGAQLVFCDELTPNKEGRFSAYDALKGELVRLGIPAKDIAFVHETATDEARNELFQKVKEGEIRVLIGSTSKMGAGTNMQKHLVALHHLDVPWRPRDVEQREGRIIRQGNQNKDVTIYTYTQEGSFDGNSWDTIRLKANMISQAIDSNTSDRSMEISNADGTDYQELVKASQNNPYTKELMEKRQEQAELQAQEAAFKENRASAESVLEVGPQNVARQQELLAGAEDDVKALAQTDSSKFSMTIDGKTYSKRNEEANEAFTKAMSDAANDYAAVIRQYGYNATLHDVKIASARGFDIYVRGDNQAFRVNPSVANLQGIIKRNGTYVIGAPSVIRAWNAIERAPNERAEGCKSEIARCEAEIAAARETLKDGFSASKKARLEALADEITKLQQLEAEKNREINARIEASEEADANRPEPVEATIYNADNEDSTIEEIDRALQESLEQAGGDSSNPDVPLAISFDKPQGWAEFKRSYLDKTGWTITEQGGRITIETTSGNMGNLDGVFQDGTDYSGEEHYLVTNRNLRANDEVRVVELKGNVDPDEKRAERRKRIIGYIKGKSFKIASGNTTLNGSESGGDRKEFANGHSKHKGAVDRVLANDENLRRVIENSVYVEEQENWHPEGSKQYDPNMHFVHFYALVNDNGLYQRIDITAKKQKDGTFTVENANLYNIDNAGEPLSGSVIKKGTGPSAHSADSKSDNLPDVSVPFDTVSVADLLAGVKDKQGRPYVVNGVLQYDARIFPAKHVAIDKNLIDDRADNTIHYSHDALQAEVMDNFPNAQNVQTSDEGLEFDLPNGHHMTVRFQDEGITVDRAQASKDYGREVGANETARGSMRITTSRDGIMTLTVDTVEETPSHEAMHFAMQFLTDRERAALNKVYGNEEAICEGMREWKIARKNHKGTLLGKIFQRISDFAYKVLGLFYETDKNVFRKVAEGQMWERKSDNASAAKVHYLMGGMEKMDAWLKKHPQFVDVKPGETRQVKEGISVKGRREDTGWGGIATAFRNTVISPSRIKDSTVQRLHAMAAKATRTMQMQYGAWTHDFGRVVNALETDEQKQAFDKLVWAEDAMKHEFTDAELRAEGVDEAVIEAHKVTRKILKDVYKKVNDVYTRAVPTTHSYNTLEEAQKAVEEAKKHPYTEVLGDINKVKYSTNGHTYYQVTIKAPHSTKHTVVVSKAEAAQLSKDKYNHMDNVEKLAGGNYKITYTAYAKPLTNMEGYVPHVFHDFMIIAKTVDENGVEHAEVVGSATTQDKAIKAAEDYRKENGDVEMLIAPKEFQSEGDLENPILLGDKDYHKLMNNLTAGSTMTLDEARALSQAMQKGRHVFFGALKQRKGAQGYEQNARWAIQHHLAASARYIALEPFKVSAINLFERTYGDYNKDFGVLSKEAFAKGYIDSMLGKPGQGEKLMNKILQSFPPFRNVPRPARQVAGTLSGLVGVLKLGASPAAAFVNVLQILNANLYLDPRKVAVGMKRAINLTEADRKLLEECGTDDEVGLSAEGKFDRIRLEENRFTRAADKYRNLTELAMTPFTKAESLIRRATTLAAYYDYVEKHADLGKKDKAALHRRAIQYALEINRKVNFDYSVADAPRIFRALQGTIVGDLALQFQKYGVKELEVISDVFSRDTTAKQKVAFLVPYLLVGGIWNALPFEDLLLSLIGLITGSDNPEAEAKKAMMEWAGKDEVAGGLVRVANYGVGSVLGMDISQRVGLKGVLPEGSNIVSGGAFGSTAAGLAKAIVNADAGGAVRSLSPEAGNIYQAISGYGTDSKGRKTVDYDGYDRVMKALGFRTVRDATAADYQNIIYNYKQDKISSRAKAKQAYLEDSTGENYDRLRRLGYTDKQIKNLGKEGNSTRLSRAEKGLSKQDVKDLQGLRDYVY